MSIKRRVSSDVLISAENVKIEDIEMLVKDGDLIKEHKVNLITGVIEDGDELIIEPGAISILEMIKDS